MTGLTSELKLEEMKDISAREKIFKNSPGCLMRVSGTGGDDLLLVVWYYEEHIWILLIGCVATFSRGLIPRF